MILLYSDKYLILVDSDYLIAVVITPLRYLKKNAKPDQSFILIISRQVKMWIQSNRYGGLAEFTGSGFKQKTIFFDQNYYDCLNEKTDPF